MDRVFFENGRKIGNYSFSQNIFIVFKRFFDIVVSLITLLVTLPIMLVVGILVKVDSEGPVIFKQERVGKNGRVFTMYKFRTMYVTAPKDVATQDLHNPDSYLTQVGRVLRQYSLDELPQVVNVLLGHMSIIGPRPLVLAEKEMHKMRTEKGVYTLRPGITGLAQVNGRDTVIDEAKLSYDCKYAENLSFRQDLSVLLKSVYVVIKRIGIVEGKAEKCGDNPELIEQLQPVEVSGHAILDQKKVG